MAAKARRCPRIKTPGLKPHSSPIGAPKPYATKPRRVRRRPQMSGDAASGAPEVATPLAVDAQGVREAAEFAVRELAAQSTSLVPPALKEVGAPKDP